MGFRVGWYFISVVKAEADTIRIESLDMDAVFATSEDDAREQASQRNPLKPGQSFRFTRAINFNSRQKAIMLHETRNEQIEEVKALADKS